MGLFDLFKKNTETADYNQMLPRFAENFTKTPTEKTAGEFLKCLSNCQLFVPVAKASYSENEDAKLYPWMIKDNDKLAMVIYSYSFPSPDDNYIVVAMDMSKALAIYDYVSQLQVNTIIVDPDTFNIKINDAFVRYLKLRGKKRLF